MTAEESSRVTVEQCEKNKIKQIKYFVTISVLVLVAVGGAYAFVWSQTCEINNDIETIKIRQEGYRKDVLRFDRALAEIKNMLRDIDNRMRDKE